jgi:hypothetical protein
MSRAGPVLLICSCCKYEEYLHAAIRRFDCPEYEIIGLVGGDTESFDPMTRILTLPVPDTYEALPSKIHAAFAWIHSNRPGTVGVFKTDDDMLFDIEALVSNINANTETPYWGVQIGVCTAGAIAEKRIKARFIDTSLRPSHQKAAYCYGWGYWISMAALPVIVAAATDYKTSFLEDVCTGFVMNRVGVAPVCIRFPYKEMPRTPELLTYK